MAIPLIPSFSNTGATTTEPIENPGLTSSIGSQPASGGGINSPSSSGIEDQNSVDRLVNNLSGAPGSNINYYNTKPLGSENNSYGSSSVATAQSAGSNSALNSTNSFSSKKSSIGSGVLTALGSIALATTLVNNISSALRSKSIPRAGSVVQDQSEGLSINQSAEDDWRVKLTVYNPNVLVSPALKPLRDTDNSLIWPHTPSVNINYKANYTAIDPVHNNIPYQAYKNSQVEDISITGEFTVENEIDAKYWIAATHFLKASTKMSFGTSIDSGNPPWLCKLSGYGSFVLNNVPVVVKSYSVELKDDVNYIGTTVLGSKQWVPAVSAITVIVAPIYSRERMRTFNLQSYLSGGELGMM